MLVIVPAAAVNEALVDPAATFTEEGIDNNPLLLDRETAAPPLGAAWLSDTVQLEAAPEPSDVGLQLSELTTVRLFTVIVPPVPVIERDVPEGEDATVLLIFKGMLPAAVADNVAVTTATVPFWIMVEFDPTIRQVYDPLPPEQ